MKVMQLMLVVSCLSCYLLLRQAMSENRTHVIEGPRPAAKHAHTLVQNLQMVNFSSQITRTCPFEDTLNIPPPLIRDATSCANCSRVTCRALLAGNDSALYEEAREFMTKHKRPIPPDAYLFDLASDCDKFKRVMGYHLKPASSEEANFSIAFNMLIHTDTEQVERLLRAIYAPQNSYCVHIDTKSEPSMQKTVRAIVGCFDNVFVASKLERVVYAGFSRLQADINCMRDQVSRPTRWRYLLNIAGQAFPLRTNLELVRILKLYNGYNDIESLYRRTLRKRIDAEWRETKDDKMELTGRKNPPPPHNIEIVRGSAYGVFSRRFVEFVVTDEKAKDLLEWSRSTFSPDEHYWSTLHHTYVNPHLNTPGGFSGEQWADCSSSCACI